MKKLYLLVTCLVVCGLIVGSFACAAPTPAATAPTPAPTAPTPAATALTPAATAPKPAPALGPVSFEGKTINLVVCVAPGGGADVLARLFSKHLPRFLPGEPTVVVRSMPGANGTIGANYVWGAKPDGLTALLATTSPAVADLLRMKGARYELVKMPAIIGTGTGSIFFTRPGIISKPEDLLKAKGIIFGGGTGGGSWIFVCAKELLNIPTEKVIIGYAGSADALRAFFAGEINMSFGSITSYSETVAPYVDKGEVILVCQSGLLDEKGNLIRQPGAPAVPTFKEIYETYNGKSPSGMAWEAYRTLVATNAYEKTLVLPPGTPDSIVRAYWGAADKMVKDSQFRKMGDPLVGEGGAWQVGEAFDKAYKLNLGADPKAVDWLKDALKKYGVVVE